MLSAARKHARRLVGRFQRDEKGVSAMEFALIAPVMAAMLGGAIEYSGTITASNRATFVADALAEMVSRVDHTITEAEMKNFAVAASLIDPDIVRYARQTNQDLEKAFKVTVSSVQFEKTVSSCTSNCAYKAKVVFSFTLNGSKRSCGQLTSVPGATTNMNQLPADVFGPGSLVVVDVEAFHKPIMPVRLADTMSFKRSSYFRPRYVPRVNYENNCSGY